MRLEQIDSKFNGQETGLFNLTTRNAGLKNRGKTVEGIEERRKAVEECTQVKLASIASHMIDPIFSNKNIENAIGTVLPLSFVDPVKINGDHAKGGLFVRMATTDYGTAFTTRCWLRLISRESVTHSIYNAGDEE